MSTKLLAAFGDERTAVVVYDTETTLLPSWPAAELVTVSEGRITHSLFIFDRKLGEAARR